jgi:TatD DNase family protein
LKLSPLIDTHAHANGQPPTALREIERAFAAGLVGVVIVGIDLASSRMAVDLARREPRIRAAVGVHPHNASRWTPQVEDALRTLAQGPEVVAIGECGLDYYRNLSARVDQERVFRAQVELAREIGKPLIVHDREAHREVLEVLSTANCTSGCVLHCFSGDRVHAERCLEHGMYLGIAGPVTYPRALALRDVVRWAPLDRLLLETDCPYLSPEPLRGRPNEPANLPLIAAAVSRIRGMEPEEVARATTENACTLLGWPPRAEGE